MKWYFGYHSNIERDMWILCNWFKLEQVQTDKQIWKWKVVSKNSNTSQIICGH